MPHCLISFGANLGHASQTICRAAAELAQQLRAAPGQFTLSRLFNTPPVGGPTGQPPFVNAVAAVRTERSPWEVWQAVRNVEQQLGRERFQRWEARRIDLDILLYDDARIWTPQLKIPHPRMCMRRFILEPAMDVAADWVDPVSGRSIAALAHSLRGGRGSLVLCGERDSSVANLLQEVARTALAQWQEVSLESASAGDQPTQPDNEQPDGLQQPGQPHRDWQSGRWVAWLPLEQLNACQGPLQVNPTPKLLMFLADKCHASGAQWEDLHRRLAHRLGLDSRPPSSGWELQGARYLLATADREWAVHEMVAALDAMDCPVEPLDGHAVQSL